MLCRVRTLLGRGAGASSRQKQRLRLELCFSTASRPRRAGPVPSHAEPRQAMSMLHVLLMIWLATDEAVGSQSRIKNPRNLIPNSPVSVQKPKFKTQVARNGVLITVQRQVFRAVGDQPMALEPGGPRFAIC